MKTLLWKDYRQGRKIFVAAASLVLLPYVVGLLFALLDPGARGFAMRLLDEVLPGSSMGAVVLAAGMAAFIAGNALAGERADRSAEFGGYLPVPRGRWLLSKAIVALAACAALQLANLVVYVLVQMVLSPSKPYATIFSFVVMCSSMLFGVAWLVSSFSSSPAIAAASGLAAFFILLTGRSLTAAKVAARTGTEGEQWLVGFPTLCLVIGLACFVAGCIYYLRRIEP